MTIEINCEMKNPSRPNFLYITKQEGRDIFNITDNSTSLTNELYLLSNLKTMVEKVYKPIKGICHKHITIKPALSPSDKSMDEIQSEKNVENMQTTNDRIQTKKIRVEIKILILALSYSKKCLCKNVSSCKKTKMETIEVKL